MNNITNCKNCGAPLKDYKCEYCGSEYEYIQEINDFKQVIKSYIGGRKRKFYIGCITCEPLYIEFTRFDYNKKYVSKVNEEIKLELISYD